jgi:hypothetical protein
MTVVLLLPGVRPASARIVVTVVALVSGVGGPPIIRSMGIPPVRMNRTARTAARMRKAMLSQVV